MELEGEPVISEVAVYSGRVDLIADQPRESLGVTTQLQTVEVLHADEPRVGVKVAHYQDVVVLPASYHCPVYVDQRLHFLQHCVRVGVDRDQHQLG